MFTYTSDNAIVFFFIFHLSTFTDFLNKGKKYKFGPLES